VAQAGLPASDYDFHLYRDELARHATQAGVGFVDLTATLEAEQAKGKPLGFNQDPHYAGAANRLIGSALYYNLLGAR
jgi:hypothetical protein